MSSVRSSRSLGALAELTMDASAFSRAVLEEQTALSGEEVLQGERCRKLLNVVLLSL